MDQFEYESKKDVSMTRMAAIIKYKDTLENIQKLLKENMPYLQKDIEEGRAKDSVVMNAHNVLLRSLTDSHDETCHLITSLNNLIFSKK